MRNESSAAAGPAAKVGLQLHEFLRSRMPGAKNLQLADVQRTSVGQSRENWVFRAQWQDGDGQHDTPLILRRDPAGGLIESERRVEFGVLKALAGSAVPVPAVHFLDEDGAAFGRPSLIMGRMAGTCEFDVLNGPAPLKERLALARQFLAMVVRIQQVDWQALGLDALLGNPGANSGLAELDRWEAELRRVQLEPQPEMDLVLGWLRACARPAKATVLVHGDFKPGNTLLKDGAITAVLDWETVHLGDPLEDLGWVLNPVRAAEHQIVGSWERSHVVAAYEQLTGRNVDAQALRWWIVFSNWKLCVILLTGVRVFIEGRLDRIHQSPTWILRTMLKMIKEN